MARFEAPDARRRQILAAVAELLLADGIDALTVSRVADRAGIAKGTVYLYFDSKQALLAALQADLWRKMLPEAVLADEELAWGARLDRLVAAWVDAELAHADLYHVLFHLQSGGEEPMGAARDLLVRVLRGGVAAGEFDIADLDLTADFLLHAYLGPCHHGHHSGGEVTAGVQALFRRVVAVGRS